MPPGRRPDHR